LSEGCITAPDLEDRDHIDAMLGISED